MNEIGKEIDLLELFVKIYIYLRKYILIIGIFVAVGIIFSVISHKFISKEYKSEMILSIKPENDYLYAITFNPKTTTKRGKYYEIVDNLIQTLNNQLLSKNFENLSKELNVDKKSAAEILSLEGKPSEESQSESDYLYTVICHASNPDIYMKLGKSIVNYLNNNSLIQKQTHSDSLLLTSIIEKTDYKIKELDSIQSSVLNKRTNSEIVFYENLSYVTESVRLISLKEKLLNDLHNLKKVEVVHDFYLPYVKESSLFKKIAYSILICLSLSFILIFFLIIRNKAKNYTQHKN